jgi:PEP-CTERM/exosortase A-associated glycosyltransferase
MTRVLHVLDHSLPLHSGYTFRTRAIMKAQAGLGLEVRGITGQRHNLEAGGATDVGGSPEQADGLTFHRTPGLPEGPPPLRELGEIAALDSAIRNLAAQGWRPDIIHAHSPALWGAAASRAARALGVPLVYEIRAFWEDAAVGNLTGTEGSLKYRLTRALETRVAKQADALFTICDGLRDDLIARGIAPARIGVMRNGVDLDLFGAPVPRDPALAKALGIAPGAPVIGYIGSFYAYEGVDDLIAAMPLLRRSHPDARLLLVGAGPMDAAWRAAAAALPEPEAVIFTGRVAHDAVERYYALIDVLAYPRKAQRLTDLVTPLKPLEAMAQRRLVAASSVGGHRELITDGATGTLFAPDDPAACAAALAGLLANREGWEAIKDRALTHVRTRHDWAVNARHYLSVYHLLIARGEGGDAGRIALTAG